MIRNRVLIYIFLVLALLGAAIFFSAAPLALRAVKYTLNNTLPESAVHIEKIRFRPLSSITFLKISVKRKGVYDFTVEEACINYNIQRLLAGSVEDVRLINPILSVRSPKSSVTKLQEMINVSRGAGIFKVGSLEISGFQVNIETRDIDLKGIATFKFSPDKGTFPYIDVVLNEASMQGVSLREARISGDIFQGGSGKVSAESITYNKAVMKDIKGSLHISGGAVHLDDLSARLFDGDVIGNIAVGMSENKYFSIEADITGMDMETLIKDFDLTEKFQLTGRLSGNMSVKGIGLEIEDVKGKLEAAPGGGLLVIKDTGFLEKLASQPDQTMEMAAESLKDYVYNTGNVNLSLDDSNNVVLGIEMEGDSGRRVFNIVLHDIIPIKRGKI